MEGYPIRGISGVTDWMITRDGRRFIIQESDHWGIKQKQHKESYEGYKGVGHIYQAVTLYNYKYIIDE